MALHPIGVSGLGRMGGAIAANLVKNGHTVRGFDPKESAQQALTQAGGTPVTLEELATACPVIFFALPAVSDLEDDLAVIKAHAKPGTILVECSTFPVEDKLRLNNDLADTGIIMLDAPLSGTGAQAKTGDITVFVSGDQTAAEQVAPLIADFSRSQDYLGAFGNGMKMKCAANLMVAIHNVAAAEGMLLATRSGLPAQMAYDVLSKSGATSRILEVRGPMMVEEVFTPPSFTAKLMMKDLGLIADAVKANGLCAPLFDAAAEIHREASISHPEEDTASVYAVLADKVKNC
ncbi:MAG: NAD(P)-dependent oxidoreductase [Oscillospiraceae bacterium]|nr:NAD(P)-dependent oxidoreductase [Oscillospiraceae bacterium]